MKAFALLSLAIAASVALAVPAPLPDSDYDNLGSIVNSLPLDANPSLGPPTGKGKPPSDMSTKHR